MLTKCASKLLFSIKEKSRKILMIIDITLKVRFLTNCHSQNETISFEYVDFWQTILLFKDPSSKKFHNRTVAKKYFMNFLPVSCMGRS